MRQSVTTWALVKETCVCERPARSAGAVAAGATARAQRAPRARDPPPSALRTPTARARGGSRARRASRGRLKAEAASGGHSPGDAGSRAFSRQPPAFAPRTASRERRPRARAEDPGVAAG